MTRRNLALALCLTAALSACTMAEAPAVLPDENACGASGLQGLVGQPASVLASMTFAMPMRVIRPGMAVTMDYSPARLNVAVDDAGKITRVSCG